MPHIKATGIELSISGKTPMIKEFGNQAEFSAAVSALLGNAGFAGSFYLAINSKIRGSAHNRGLQLGQYDRNRRTVELRWQGGDNGTRFAVMLSAPQGMNVEDVHARLQATMKRIEEAEAAAKDARGKGDDPAPDGDTDSQAPAPAALTEGDLEVLFQDFMSGATAAGVIPRQLCEEKLLALGYDDVQSVVASLLAGGHIEPGSSDAFLKVSARWVQYVRALPPPVEVATPAVIESSVLGRFTAEDLISGTNRLTAIVDKAATYRVRLPDVKRDIGLLEGQIATATERLAGLCLERDEAEAFLSGPEVREAEQTLASLSRLLKK